MHLTIIRRPEVRRRLGYSNSTLYLRIADGLVTPSISLGPRCVGWPEYEIDAIIRARIAGKSDNDLRLLVIAMVEARKQTKAKGGLCYDN